MLKKLSLYFSCLAICISLFGCSNSNNIKSKNNNSGPVSAKKDKTDNALKSFASANIISIEQIGEATIDSTDSLYYKFKIKNNSKTSVYDISFEFDYKDKDGNVLSDDGRMLDYQLAPDKTAFIYSYFTEDSSHNKDVSTCVPKNYEYTANNVKYDIDLVSKELEYEADDDIEDKVDFSKANILSFEYISNKKSSDDYEVSLKVINNSNTPIPYCDYNMVYLDENENWLSDDSRMIDSEIQTGKYALTTSYAFPDNTNLIKKYWVYKYSYDLKSKDENGYVHYDVDLQRKIAIGSTEKEN